MGAVAEERIGEYLQDFNGQCIIEIGCGDSTEKLARIAKENNQSFIAIDPTRNYNSIENITYVGNMFGEEYLEKEFPKLNKQISAAYLDNFDWMWEPELFRSHREPEYIRNQVIEYAEMNVIMNNVNSSKVHLQQTMLIEKYSADKCVVLFDDTWFDKRHETYIGKGGSGIMYLVAKGWKVLWDVGYMHNSAVMVQKQ